MEKNELIKQVNDREVMDSRDVAKMIGKTHAHLMRDISRYINDILTDPKLDSLDFFIESSYEDAKGEVRKCYLLTKQGCEFVANKMTGRKGNIFTATFVGLFNKYEAEHNQKLLPGSLEEEKLKLEIRRQEYREDWMTEFKKQNANKSHELRNDDARLWLRLAEVADDYGRRNMATEMRNEAINTMTALPLGARREYTAKEIGFKLGVSPIMVGKWGNKLGIKKNPQLSCRTKEGAWRYYPEALEVFERNALEIQDDFINGEDY